MKVYNYILITGILLSSIAPVHAHNSIVPWSWSSALSSASSTIGSWGSSALSGISALSTEAKVATLGGLAVLTGGYIGYVRKKNALPENDPDNQFRSWLDSSDLIRGGDPRLRAMTSVPPRERRYSISDFSVQPSIPSRSRSQSISGIDLASLVQSQPELPVNIQHCINQLSPRQKISLGRLSPYQLDVIRERRALEALQAAKKSQAKRRKKEKENQGYDYSGDKDFSGAVKKLFEHSDNGFVLLDDEDCGNPHECLVQKGQNYMRLLCEVKWHQVATDKVDPLLALICANKDSDSDAVNIQGAGASNLLEYYWHKKNNEDKERGWFPGSSTYVGESGALVVVIPQGVRQHYALPDSMSYIKLLPRKDGITISYQEQKPTEADSLVAHINQRAGQIQSVLSGVAQEASPYLNRVAKEISDAQELWKIYQGNCLREAAARGDGMRVALALFAGADVNDPVRTNEVIGLTALHAAVQNGHREVVQKLLDAGANIEAVYRDHVISGMSSLQLAVQNNNKVMVHLLAAAGAEFSLDTIKKLWNSALDNPADDVLSQLNVINHAYSVIECQLKAELAHLDIKRISQATQQDLKKVKAKFELLYNDVRAKATSLNSITQQAMLSPEDLFKKVHGEWKRNKLPDGFTPQECYIMLGFKETPTVHQKVVDALKSQLDSPSVSEEHKKILRQVGYMLREESKRKLFDIYMDATMKHPELLAMTENPSKISLDSDVLEALGQFNLDGKGMDLFAQLSAVKTSESAQYITEIMGDINRKLKQQT